MIPCNQTQAELNSLATRYEKAFFHRFPELAHYWGRSDAALNQFRDHSLAAHQAWLQKEDDFLQQLLALNSNELFNSPAHRTYQLLKATLEDSIGARIAQEELWNINPLWGWHNILAMLAEKQPVITAEHRALAIERWQTFAHIVDHEITNLQQGLFLGYTAPKPAVKRVINQLNIILQGSIEDSPFFEFALRADDRAFKQQMFILVSNIIHPALQRYVNYLDQEYHALAREKIGISAIANGMKCYQAKIQKETTLNISPQEIFDFGRTHMQQLIEEVGVIGQKLFGTQNITEVFRLANAQSQGYFKTAQDILAYNQQALARAKDAASHWFNELPKAEGILKPYPLHRSQTGAAGEYHPPTEDGLQPGIFYINTYDPQLKSRLDQEATLFHELIPGHHFQVGLAHEDQTQHHLEKYLWTAGFGEGWALYTERLADEMGLYTDDISRLGMLSNEALRTARLVVDPGIHVMDWSRDNAIDYLKQHTAMDNNMIEAEIDRYIMEPAQATSYMLGKREIVNLRNQAQKQLNKKFSIKEFHQQVLKNGCVTLPMLRQQINEWLAAVEAK